MRSIVCIAIACTGSLLGATAADRRVAIAAAAEAPLSFERATGGNTRWMARGNGFRLAVGAADVVTSLGDERLRIRFVGGNDKAPSVGLDALPGKVNYFVGRDPKSWLRDIPTYARVRYSGVYPGVDVLWHGNRGRLEYDLDLQPGADSSRIAMRFDGARKLSLEASGDLRVEMAGGSLSLKLPVVYQDGAGGRKRIDARYDLRAGNQVGFHLAAYDKSRPLVIDPTLVYASYFGSSGLALCRRWRWTAPATCTSAGARSASNALPTVNALQPGNLGVTGRMPSSPSSITTGKTVLYSTYLGGSGDDQVLGLAVDCERQSGRHRVYDFRRFPARQSRDFRGVPGESVFAFKLNAAGKRAGVLDLPAGRARGWRHRGGPGRLRERLYHRLRGSHASHIRRAGGMPDERRLLHFCGKALECGRRGLSGGARRLCRATPSRWMRRARHMSPEPTALGPW
jgi:hypothetical protein